MPASYTHQWIAEHIAKSQTFVRKGMSEYLWEDAQRRAAYLAGCEGPDPLFFTLFTIGRGTKPPVLGHKLHEMRTSDFLMELLQEVKKQADAKLESKEQAEHTGTEKRQNENLDILYPYVLGFLTHYGADAQMHPFIFTRSLLEDGSLDSNKHCKYEHTLDSILWKEAGNALVPPHMTGYVQLGKKDKAAIAAAFARACNRVFPEYPIGERAIRNSFNHSVFLCNLLHRISKKKHSVLLTLLRRTSIGSFVDSHVLPQESLEKLKEASGYSSYYYSWGCLDNRNHSPWYSYWERDRERTESIYELLELAVARGQELIGAADQYMKDEITKTEMERILGDYSYNSGILWNQTGPITRGEDDEA